MMFPRPLVKLPERLGGIRDAHHLLELFGVAAPIEQPAPGAITATEVEEINARETLAFLFSEFLSARIAHSRQKSLNLVGDNSVYLTVCWMF